MIELTYVQSWAVDGTGGDEMIAYVSEIAEKGLWGVICVHGVGGEHRPIETRAFQKLARFLSRNRQRIWSDTMTNIAKYILDRRATRPRNSDGTAGAYGRSPTSTSARRPGRPPA